MTRGEIGWCLHIVVQFPNGFQDSEGLKETEKALLEWSPPETPLTLALKYRKPSMKKQYLPSFIGVLPLAFCIPSLIIHVVDLFLSLTASPSFGWSYGQGDFAEYWSAFQLFVENKNPYSPALMLETQRVFGPRTEPMMMWNPPWLLALFSPLLAFDFTSSAKVWSVANVVAYLSAAVITLASTETVQKKRIQLLATCALFTLCFPPIWMCLKLGQIAGFLTFGLSLFIFGIKHQKRVPLGLSFLLLSLKPHLFILLCAFLVWWVVREKRLTWIIPSLSPLLGLIVLTGFIAPNSLTSWIAVINNQESITGVLSPNRRVTASLLSIASKIVSPDDSQLRLLTLRLLTILSVPVMFFYLRKSRGPTLTDERISLIIALSVALSPFSWFFDHAVLLVPLILICNAVVQVESRQGVLIISLFSMLIALASYSLDRITFHHELFWFSPVFTLIIIIYMRQRRTLPPVD